MPAATGTAAYRIVQEALANVWQHAPGAAADVRVVVERGRLRVVVANGASTAVAAMAAGAGRSEPAASGRGRGEGGRQGLGLTGMAERARALGGVVEAGPTSDGGWRVVADLPVPSRRGWRPCGS